MSLPALNHGREGRGSTKRCAQGRRATACASACACRRCTHACRQAGTQHTRMRAACGLPRHQPNSDLDELEGAGRTIGCAPQRRQPCAVGLAAAGGLHRVSAGQQLLDELRRHEARGAGDGGDFGGHCGWLMRRVTRCCRCFGHFVSVPGADVLSVERFYFYGQSIKYRERR
jgi:hypothetical protein